MNPRISVLIIGVTISCACLTLVGCATRGANIEAKRNHKIEKFEELEWSDARRTSPSNLQPVLERVAMQEGGDWSGPYGLQELEKLLPEGLKTDEYRGWISAFYRRDGLEYYVISKAMPYSFRKNDMSVETVGRFPICVLTVSVMQDGSYYRRFVFNATAADRKVQ